MRPKLTSGLLALSVAGNAALAGAWLVHEPDSAPPPARTQASGVRAAPEADSAPPPTAPEVGTPAAAAALPAGFEARALEDKRVIASLRARLRQSEAALDADSNRGTLRDLLDLFAQQMRGYEAGEGLSMEQIQRSQEQIQAKMMRLMSEREATLNALLDVIDDPEDPQRPAALHLFEALSMLPSGAPAELARTNARVLDLLERGDADTLTAQALLSALELDKDADGRRRAEPILLGYARKLTPLLEYEVVSRLGALAASSPAANDELQRIASDVNAPPQRRAWAVEDLVLGESLAARNLLFTLSEAGPPEVRASAFKRFRDLPAAEVLPRLHAALPQADDAQVRFAILLTLSEHGTEATAALMQGLVDDERRDVGARAEIREFLESLRRGLEER